MVIVLIGMTLMLSEQEAATKDSASIIDDHPNIKDRQMSLEDLSVKNESSKYNTDNGYFTSVFDGETLDAWKIAGDGGFAISEEDGTLQTEKGGGLLWYAQKKYDNFVLKLE